MINGIAAISGDTYRVSARLALSQVCRQGAQADALHVTRAIARDVPCQDAFLILTFGRASCVSRPEEVRTWQSSA
jgi:hypothetical protein